MDKKGLENLRREQIFAKAFSELDAKHVSFLKGVATLQSLVQQHQKELCRLS